jgi:hypothetical protein
MPKLVCRDEQAFHGWGCDQCTNADLSSLIHECMIHSIITLRASAKALLPTTARSTPRNAPKISVKPLLPRAPTAALRTRLWLASRWGCRGRRPSMGGDSHLHQGFDSCRRTTSDSEWPRKMPSALPSGDQWKVANCSEWKLVRERPTEPSRG